jgi:hypothetical protein
MVKKLLLALLSVAAVLALAAPAHAQTTPLPPTLTGETLDSSGLSSDPGQQQNCDANGFVYTYRAAGLAIGPYPGTFVETGTIRVGANTLAPSPGLDGVLVRGPILEFHAHFTIFSADAMVTGTKSVSAGDVLLGNASFTCGNAMVGSNPVQVRHATPFQAQYQATITTSTGSFRDEGTALVSRLADTSNTFPVPLPPGTFPGLAVSDFIEMFFSNNLAPVPLGPAAVIVTPKAAANPVQTQHEVTATVTNAAGGPVSQTRVLFFIVGTSGEALEKSCTTQQDGRCSITYTRTFPGADTITACADSNDNQERDPGEPCDEATKEWVLPVSTPGATTGGGQILHVATTGTTFGFTFDANDVVNGLKGECNVLDHAPATDKVDCLNVLAYVQTANEATVYGNATLNGEDHGMFRLHVVDNSESGIGTDMFEFETEQGYVRTGLLTEGNIQVHPVGI